MSVRWRKHRTPEETAEACAQHITSLLEQAISGEGDASIAVSGGSTPKLLFESLRRIHFHWDRVHLFWVDERAVPPTAPDSNYHLTETTLIAPAHIPRRNVHRIQAELTPHVAAQRYVDEIREFFSLGPGEIPHFDVIHQGMGADGHTASLFPGEPLIQDREGIAASVFVEKMNASRVTLLPAVLLAARHTVMLVTGSDKAETIHQVIHGEYDPSRLPAQLAHHARQVVWFFDDAAAQRVD